METLIASDRAKVYLIPQSALPQNDAGTLGVRLIGTDNIVEIHKIEIVRDTTEGVWVTSLPQVANLIVVGQAYVVEGVEVAPTLRGLILTVGMRVDSAIVVVEYTDAHQQRDEGPMRA